MIKIAAGFASDTGRGKENMKTSHGDMYDCPCPACGKSIEFLWELGDSLVAGKVITCDSCEEEVTVSYVDVTVDICLTFKED